MNLFHMAATGARHGLALLVFVTALAVFVPALYSAEHMGTPPLHSLDGSWTYAMDEAVARHLRIGKDIIFTFGPYASIYTRSFNPSTYGLMLFGSAWLGLGYALLLWQTGRRRPAWRLLMALFFMVALAHSRDALFFSYPLAVAACAAQFAKRDKASAGDSLWLAAAAVFVSAPLGLLPLVKGSTVLICGATALAVALYLEFCGRRAMALAVVVGPLAALPGFWALSGQAIGDLPSYFTSPGPIISGYTEAMAEDGNGYEIGAYLAVTAVILASLLAAHSLALPAKALLAIGFALFQFVAFKAGFVRHDLHALVAGGALLFAAATLNLCIDEKHTAIPLLAALAAWYYIDSHYVEVSANKVAQAVRDIYASLFDGSRLDSMDGRFVRHRFDEGLATVRKICPLPALQGSTDIYSTGQACVLASDNAWNPRPVFQSYSVYTPGLAHINEQHLRGASAPDNVLFRVEPIDLRLPTLEDGLSWPALFDNYRVTGLDGGFAYLRKRPNLKPLSDYSPISEDKHQTGEEVPIPASQAPLYAEIDIKPTGLGKLYGLLFKPPPLMLDVKFKHGGANRYRVASNMMQTGFFLSPLATGTTDFVLMATNHTEFLSDHQVQSIALKPLYGASTLWSKHYTLRLKAYRPQQPAELPASVFDRMDSAPPAGYAEDESAGRCDASIDKINGIVPTPQQTPQVIGSLSVEGWLAVSAKDGIPADEVYVTLRDAAGVTRYVKAKRSQRDDVSEHFKQAGIPVGYAAVVDVSGLHGNYTLGLLRSHKGRFERCGAPTLPLAIGVETFEAMDGALPARYADAKIAQHCDAVIEKLNGVVSLPQHTVLAGSLLSVEGWLAVSAKDGIAADQVFVTLKDAAGAMRYIKARRSPREDVKAYFKQAAMADAGYAVKVDTDKLHGAHALGLARVYKGQLELCELPTVSLEIIGQADLGKMEEDWPTGYAEAEIAKQCDGSIDKVNGSAPVPRQPSTVEAVLSVQGWLAVSAKDGVAADEVFVTLKDAAGAMRYIKARHTPRDDVKAYFKQTAMPDIGYAVVANIANLQGEYTLGLAHAYKGRLELCESFGLPLTIHPKAH